MSLQVLNGLVLLFIQVFQQCLTTAALQVASQARPLSQDNESLAAH